MKTNDSQPLTLDQLRELLQQHILANNADGVSETFGQITQRIHDDMLQEVEQRVSEARQALDAQVRASRGEAVLTSQERDYYQKLAAAMASNDPKQALANLDVVMPQTVIERVFERLRTEHPLLSHINFIPTGAAIKMIYNANGYQEAAWGELCDEIVKELVSGFKVADTNLLKLSAFIPVCREALELGPEWLDRYVREVLYEAFANGLEAGIVNGDGNGKPIGMTRQVGDNVTVTGGVYPQKTLIVVNSLDVRTLGNLLSLLAQSENGLTRYVNDVIFVVNPVDYFKGVFPVFTVKGPDGTYREEKPYPMTIIQSNAMPLGKAVLGLGYRYFAALGSPKDGRIDYSDHAQFLQDKRVYLIKGFSNGFPMDNNAFQFLDISNLEVPVNKVQVVDGRTASSDATLSSLTLGAATLSPAFAADTTSYTAATTNATNVVNAVPADAGATMELTLNGTQVANGSALTWADGSNTLVVKVTAENGTTTQEYTVTVTKS